jgi:hypothetical protein
MIPFAAGGCRDRSSGYQSSRKALISGAPYISSQNHTPGSTSRSERVAKSSDVVPLNSE